MDDDGVDPGIFEENNIPHYFANELWIVHGGAAHFDEEGFSPEALQVGKRGDENLCFLRGVRHGGTIMKRGRLDQ